MSDPTPVVVVPAAVPVTPDAPVVKSGWKTTELYLAVVVLGFLAYAGQQLITLLPTILATPGIPAWAASLAPAAIVGLGLVMRLVVAEYTNIRLQLKLPVTPPDVSTAVAAGAAAANAGQAATLAAGNS